MEPVDKSEELEVEQTPEESLALVVNEVARSSMATVTELKKLADIDRTRIASPFLIARGHLIALFVHLKLNALEENMYADNIHRQFSKAKVASDARGRILKDGADDGDDDFFETAIGSAWQVIAGHVLTKLKANPDLHAAMYEYITETDRKPLADDYIAKYAEIEARDEPLGEEKETTDGATGGATGGAGTSA